MSATTMSLSTFQTVLAGTNVIINLTLFNNYSASMDFNWMNILYHFEVKSWSGRGLTDFVTLFLSHKLRDPTMYGSINPSDGALTVNGTQKQEIIIQACKDILRTIDLIVQKHGRSLLDYAVWYLDKRTYNPSDYPEYITRQACNCIIHGNLLAPGVVYDLVQFDQ